MDDETIKLAWRAIIAFIGPVVGYLVWDRKRQLHEVDELKKRLQSVEQQAAVISSVMEHIREDIREIKDMLNSRKNNGTQYIARDRRNGGKD